MIRSMGNTERYRESQLAIGWDEELCARYDEIALEDHSYVATKAERSRHENSWKNVLHSSGPNGNAATVKKQKELCRGCAKNMEIAMPKSNQKINFANDEATRSLSIMKAWNGEIRKEGGSGIQRKPRQVHLQHGEARNNGGRLGAGTINVFLSQNAKVFSRTGNGDSLVSDGRCTGHHKTHATLCSRTRDVFSCSVHSLSIHCASQVPHVGVAQGLTGQDSVKLCVPQHSSMRLP